MMFACRKTSINGVLLLLLSMPVSSNALAPGFGKATEIHNCIELCNFFLSGGWDRPEVKLPNLCP